MNILASFLVTVSLLTTGALATKAPIMPDIAFNPIETHISTPSTIKEKVYLVADQYGVSGDSMWATILCEDRQLDPMKQSGYYKNGTREQSYGLVQINLPSHPDVTYDEATDVDFSINFMAKQFAKGNQKIWSCFKPTTSR